LAPNPWPELSTPQKAFRQLALLFHVTHVTQCPTTLGSNRIDGDKSEVLSATSHCLEGDYKNNWKTN
jgi:hypothetical protein